MKTRMIELKIIEVEGGKDKMIYREWLTQVLSRPANPQVGMTLDEQRKLAPIFDIIDPVGVDIPPAVVYLTEEHWQLVVEKVKIYPFPGYNKLFIDFADYIEGAEEVEMEPKEEEKESA